MAEYNSMLLVSMLASILFLGGWHGPLPVFDWAGIAYESAASPFSWGGFLANVFGIANLILKGFLGVAVMMWVRWTLPRLRIDQVMRTCLKYCTPIACFCFLGAAIWCWAFPGGVLLKPAPFAGVRETDEMIFTLSAEATDGVANSSGEEADAGEAATGEVAASEQGEPAAQQPNSVDSNATPEPAALAGGEQ